VPFDGNGSVGQKEEKKELQPLACQATQCEIEKGRKRSSEEGKTEIGGKSKKKGKYSLGKPVLRSRSHV